MSGGHITGYHSLPSIADEIERLAIEQPELGPDVLGRYRLAAEHARRAYEAIRAVDYLEGGDYGRESFVQAWDALVGDPASALRAEVQRLKRERDAAIDERNAWRSGHQDATHEADRLRGEVQRLTEEARRSAAGRVEVPELTCQNCAAKWCQFHGIPGRACSDHERLSPSPQPATAPAVATGLLPCPFCGKTPKVEPKDPERHGDAWATVFCPDDGCPANQGANVTNEHGHAAAVADALTIWNRRASSPQPATVAVVKIPEPTGISFFADGRDYEQRRRDVLQGIQWARLNARIVYPATCKDSLQVPQPSADVVVVSREEWAVIEEILKVSAICANEGGTDLKCCTQTDDHHIPLTRLRALRSSTNHDAQDAGEGR